MHKLFSLNECGRRSFIVGCDVKLLIWWDWHESFTLEFGFGLSYEEKLGKILSLKFYKNRYVPTISSTFYVNTFFLFFFIKLPKKAIDELSVRSLLDVSGITSSTY